MMSDNRARNGTLGAILGALIAVALAIFLLNGGGNTWAKRPSTATLICPRSPRAKGNKQKLARSVPRMQRVAGRRAGRLSDRTLGGSLSLNERDARMSARAFAPQRTRGRGRSRADAHPPRFRRAFCHDRADVRQARALSRRASFLPTRLAHASRPPHRSVRARRRRRRDRTRPRQPALRGLGPAGGG